MTSESKTEHVVVGVDGSPASAAALSWAIRYARGLGATIRAVLAWHYPAAVDQALVGVAPKSVTANVERSRDEILEQAITDAIGAEPGVPIEREITYGHPAQVLIEESKERTCSSSGAAATAISRACGSARSAPIASRTHTAL